MITISEKIGYWMGVTIDVFFVIYFLLVFFLRGKMMKTSIFKLGMIFLSLRLFQLIIFVLLFYPSWGIKVTVSGCTKVKQGDQCMVSDDKCTNGCGDYEEIQRNFNIESYKKYLTKKTQQDNNGSSHEYDITRLATSEILSYLSCIIYLLTLYFIHNNLFRGLKIINLFGILTIICIITMLFVNDKDTKYIDTIQLISVSIILVLSIFCSQFNKIKILYTISILLIITFILLPRIFISHDEKCSDRSKIACVKNKDDDLSCGWNENDKTCEDYNKINNSNTNSCSLHKDENTCLSNDCYYVKLNVERNDLNNEGKSKVDSKIGCISSDNKCNGYSCTGEFYPLNIFDDCCNGELDSNECTQDEIQSHLDDAKDILDETKQEGSDIKTLYGAEAWSKKVDLDESYRYCESKNRRAEIDADIYA